MPDELKPFDLPAMKKDLERSFFIHTIPGVETLFEHSDQNRQKGTVLQRPDGSVSTVFSITVEDDRLNDGKPTLIPTIYDGKEVPPEEAINRALASKKRFPAFDSLEEADKVAPELSRLMGD